MKFFFSLLITGLAFTSIAQPGTLDNTFGSGGKVITEFNDGSSEIWDAAKQQDEKIIVCGVFLSKEGTEHIMVVRYLQSGELDYSFGDSGRVLTDLGYPHQQAFAVTVQADGKIILAGQVTSARLNDDYDVAVLRYNADGSRDELFGEQGVTINEFYKDDYAYDATVQEDGKILIVGQSNNSFLTARYLSNGQLDNTFGNNGYTTSFQGLSTAKGIQLQADGKIIVGGIANGSYYAVIRYSSGGTYDSSFGMNGRATTYFGFNSFVSVGGIALTQNGNIVAAGYVGETGATYQTIVQYTSAGKLDTVFGINGIVTLTLDSLYSTGNAVTIQDNKVVVFGSTYKPSATDGFLDILIVRYLGNGALDTTFAGNGLQRTEFNLYGELPVTGFIDRYNRLVVAGLGYKTLNLSKTNIILARYNSDSTVKKDKYVKIKRWLHRHGITWDDCPKNICDNLKYYTVERSTNGGAFTEIVKLFSKNNSTQQYFEDVNLPIGTSYYRVGVVSADNSTRYSNMLQLNNNNTSIKLYPNPAQNNLRIEGLPGKQSQLIIADLAGNTRMKITITSSTYVWNISRLPKGNYVLHIQTDNELVKRKFLKE